jgi:hypothetical protein
MINCADSMRNERKDNEDLIPKDLHGEYLEVVKEQIIDLNDKFDFLISLMIKGNKMGYVHNYEQTDFTYGEKVEASLNRASVSFGTEEIVSAVHEFENKAKQVTGVKRRQFRKPEPKKNLTERVKEAIKV